MKLRSEWYMRISFGASWTPAQADGSPPREFGGHRRHFCCPVLSACGFLCWCAAVGQELIPKQLLLPDKNSDCQSMWGLSPAREKCFIVWTASSVCLQTCLWCTRNMSPHNWFFVTILGLPDYKQGDCLRGYWRLWVYSQARVWGTILCL